MIGVDRGEEPEELSKERSRQLARAELSGHPRDSGDFRGYEVEPVRDVLPERQTFRCAYCELPIDRAGYSIEHFRPKTRADFLAWEVNDPPPKGHEEFYVWFDELPSAAKPDRTHWIKDRERYWWLAWTWENLFYACPTCNSTYKQNRFPLQPGCSPLAMHVQPPDSELALLIDPASDDPLDHIRFAPDLRSESHSKNSDWGPLPLTEKGRWTIAVLGLHKRPGLRTRWSCAARQIEDDLDFQAIRAIRQQDPITVSQQARDVLSRQWERVRKRLLSEWCDFLALRWSVFDYYIPEDTRNAFDLALPRPGQRARRTPRPVWEPRPELDDLPRDLQIRVRALAEHASAEEMDKLITALCSAVPMTLQSLAAVLRRGVAYLQTSYLTRLTQGPTSPLLLDPQTGCYVPRP